jgi:hypothetical protein
MSLKLQLSYFDNIENPHNSFLYDDPVRGNIPAYMRYAHNRGVFSLTHHNYFQPEALSCVAYIGHVPESEDDLFDDTRAYDVAVFYTVWSYPRSVNGAGRKLINAAVDHIRWFRPFVKRVVTLSPKTEMARRFHTLNGAFEFRENETTINYEYKI